MSGPQVDDLAKKRTGSRAPHDRLDGRFGSFSTDSVGLASRSVSGAPPKADTAHS